MFIRDTRLWLTSPEAGKSRYWCLLLSMLGTLRVPAATHALSEKSIYDMSYCYLSLGNNTLSQSLQLLRSPRFWSEHEEGANGTSVTQLQSSKKLNKWRKKWNILAVGSKHTAQERSFQESHKLSQSINHVLLLHCSPGWKMDLKWAEKCANACIFAPWEHGGTRHHHPDADQPLMRQSQSACFYLCGACFISGSVSIRVFVLSPLSRSREMSL